MKAYVLWTVTGPKLVATTEDFIEHPDCLEKLSDKGIKKFIAQEVPISLVEERYGEQYKAVLTDPKATDELRMVDTSGERVLTNFSFKELGQPIYFEPEISPKVKTSRPA